MMQSEKLKVLYRMVHHQFSPSGRTYVLCHLLMLTIGFAICMTPWAVPNTIIGTVVLAAGGSLIAAGIAGHVLYLHVKWSQKEEGRLEEIRRAGVEYVFEKRSVAMRSEYDTRLERASKSIDILGFGLQHLREDHLVHFSDWANRAKVRILVIDPESPISSRTYANQRDLEEGNEQGQISQDVHALVSGCRHMLTGSSGRFEIRLYTCLPSVNIFRIDDEVFWGPYFVGGVSRNMPTFLLDGGGFVSQAIMEHFERIWTDPGLSRNIPSEWLTRSD